MKKGFILRHKVCSSAKEIVADEPVLVNSKPTVLRTVDKSRPADWKANKQKKARDCSSLVPHFDMRYDLRFDMTAAKMLLFLNFSIFSLITIAEKQSVIIASKWYMTIVSKSTIWYLPSFRYDIWLSFWNEENENMTITLIWHRLRQSANQSAGAENFLRAKF